MWPDTGPPFRPQEALRFLRVAIVATGVGHVTRGVEAWAVDLAHELRAYEQIEPRLLQGDSKKHCDIEEWLPCLKRNSTIWGGAHSSVPTPLRGVAEQFSSVPSLLAKALVQDYDVIHTADGVVAKWFQGLCRRPGVEIPVILNTASSSIEFCRRFDFVETIAPQYKQQAAKMGLETDRWFVNYYWVDGERFSPPTLQEREASRESLGIPRDSFVLISVGALDWRHKRMHYVIDEVARLRARTSARVFLLLAGASVGADTDYIRNLAKERLKKDYLIISDLGRTEMPKLYKAADLFCLASTGELFGLVVIEAMATGLPALVHANPIQEWIVGQGGLALDMREPGLLAETVLHFLASEDETKAYSKEARKRCLNTFSREKVLPGVVEMYRSIANFKSRK